MDSFHQLTHPKFLPASKDNHRQLALVIGQFAPFHRGHQLVIEQVLADNRRLGLAILEPIDLQYSAHPGAPAAQRASLLRDFYPQAEIAIAPWRHQEPWSEADWRWLQGWLTDCWGKIDVVYGGDHQQLAETAALLNAEAVSVDPDREKVSISSAQLREDAALALEYSPQKSLPPLMVANR